MMTEAGLLERYRDGRAVIHRVRPDVFAQLRTVLQIGRTHISRETGRTTEERSKQHGQ
jgi:hypothetical protein